MFDSDFYFAKQDDICLYCGNSLTGEDSEVEYQGYWFCSEHCKEQWATPEDYTERVSGLQRIMESKTPPSSKLTPFGREQILRGIKLHIPREDDFCWDDFEGGDWHVYACGNENCEIGWHKVCYATNIKRENGILTIEIEQGDSDGDWQTDIIWTEGEDYTELTNFEADMLYNYFKGWAEYWLDCALYNQDPLDEVIDLINKHQEFYLKQASEAIEYM